MTSAKLHQHLNRKLNTLLHGRPEPPAQPTPLRAGPLTLHFDNGDLRYIKYGDVEVVRRIYAAARDRGWGTAANMLSNIVIDARTDSFDIRYTCTNRHADIDFVWEGRISGRRDGTLTFVFDGVARKLFQRARLGICVLHPPSAAGDRARVEQVDGSSHEARFPRAIAPQRIVDGVIKPVTPFEEMRALTHEFAPGHAGRIAFSGDIFELEDQRNWTDGSFKTYCTPLRLPWPVEVRKGARVRQRVTLTLREPTAAAHNKTALFARHPAARSSVTLLNTEHTLPLLGASVGLSSRDMTARELENLQALRLAHLRVDVRFGARDWRAGVERAARHAAALDAKLELGLFFDNTAASLPRQLDAAAILLDEIRGRLARVCVYDRAAPSTPFGVVHALRATARGHAPIFAGSNMFFTQLNRSRPDRHMLALVDGISYGFNPQVHAFDDASVMESPEAQGETVKTCRRIAAGKQIALTPLTLKPRFSMSDNGPEPRDRRLEFDPRQRALFGAAWLVASLRHIALASGGDVASATFFETIDNRGIVSGARVFPLYHVLATVAESGRAMLSTRVSDPLRVDALAFRLNARRARLLLANMTAQPQIVTLKGARGVLTGRALDGTSVGEAMRAPEQYRESPGAPLDARAVALGPYAVMQVDAYE